MHDTQDKADAANAGYMTDKAPFGYQKSGKGSVLE